MANADPYGLPQGATVTTGQLVLTIARNADGGAKCFDTLVKAHMAHFISFLWQVMLKTAGFGHFQGRVQRSREADGAPALQYDL